MTIIPSLAFALEMKTYVYIEQPPVGTYVTVWSIIVPIWKESQALSRSLEEHAVPLNPGHLGGVTSPQHGQISEACERPV